MSRPPWREQAAVWLAPSQAGLALRRRGWRAGWAHHHQAVAAPDGADAALQALEALRALVQLATAAAPRRALARVVLSNRFVRTALLPDARALRGDTERRLAAQAELRGIHGDAADAWAVAVDTHAATPGLPVAALDAGWLAQLQQQARTAGLQAVSVRPLLALAAAQAWPHLAGRRAWLLVTEPDGALLARLDPAQGWQSLRSLAFDTPQDRDALPAWLARCALLDALAPADLPLVHVAWNGMAPTAPPAAPALDGWNATALALDASRF